MSQRPSKATSDEEDKDFIDVSGNNDKGLLKKIVKEGDGTLCPEGVVAIVHYTGKLTNGTVFDSSKKRRVPFTFNVGSREGKENSLSLCNAVSQVVCNLYAYELAYGDFWDL